MWSVLGHDCSMIFESVRFRLLAWSNVLTILRFEIVHDGVAGIKEVRALIEMTNFSARLSNATLAYYYI